MMAIASIATDSGRPKFKRGISGGGGGWCSYGDRGSRLHTFGVPPILRFTRELCSVQRGHKSLAAALPQNFYAVGGELAGSHIRHKSPSDASPTGFFAAPLKTTTGPGQLFAIVQATARANDPIG